MAGPAMTVSPYWQLTFDADGDADPGERDRLPAEVGARKVRDLVFFSHGWNNDRSRATALYRAFFAPFPRLAPNAKLGYVGVMWPSMRFCDEPIPDFPHLTARQERCLDGNTKSALLETFPGKAATVERIALLLDRRPPGDAGLAEFGELVGRLVDAVPARCVTDTPDEGVPAMLSESAAQMCAEFAEALHEADGTREFSLPNPWDGAKELLRQATYYAMKRRAGTVGERGLGPFLGKLAAAVPGVRVHLVGHSFGGRLVSFALGGLAPGVRSVKSVTLLQGAFSHYAFAAKLPHDQGACGALQGKQARIDGPLACCYSSYDQALGTMYPLASRMAGDARGAVGELLGEKWGAMGHNGVQAVPGTRALTLADALRGPFPASGCVNVDAAAVVRRGGPPSGAHSDIAHPELARVVLAAGRIG
ncbi:serine-threonine protein kinase [Streptomyces niveiscabiei]|uniref:serine-threonine protein kinase n=1 Tax=Streptomyces niveiscabiei TaxID=164115 RepID=UPI0029A1FD7C|nr:serine-threonine protein kinase [Streptomyces niveiscabiei]MDX3381466.1 serine-threonine protein kinase [Streptomyces niveiscabiei]